MITLIPDAGLCNRMRAIDSAIGLCMKISHPLKIYWIENSLLNCGFHDLFEPIPSAVAFIKDMKNRPLKLKNPDNLRQDWLKPIFSIFQGVFFDKKIFVEEFKTLYQKNYDFESLAGYKNVLIESHHMFYQNPELPKYTYFKPLNFIEEKVRQITLHFSHHTIGVHIRRTDNKKAIEQSPLSLFIKMMHKEIEQNSDTTFFLATDSTEVKAELRNIFGDRILLASYNQGYRSSKAGMIEAMVDLYTLSKTKKILGSYWSSFSHTASHISNIEEIVVKKDSITSRYE